MSSTLTSPGLSRRVPAASTAPFRPRINLRAHGEYHVVRFGLMPDGREISLGSTLLHNLTEARERYWKLLFDGGFLARVPRLFRPLVARWYAVEVKGYDTSPLPPLKKAS